MNIDIRKSIINNFKDADESEIKASIVSSITDKEEITLPGLGVFFEILWEKADDDFKGAIVGRVKSGISGN